MIDSPTVGIDWRTDAGRAEGRRRLFEIAEERDQFREALERIERGCGDDARPEDNAVQIAREALDMACTDDRCPW